jgi:arylsulfatase A-like enzyme
MPSLWDAMSLGVGLGWLAGLGEILAAMARRAGGEFRLLQSRDAVWMIPAVDIVVLTAAALILWTAHRLLPRRVSWRASTGVLAGIAAAFTLLAFPRLHVIAGLMLAAGIAAQVARSGVAVTVGRSRTARLATAAGVATVVGAGIVSLYARHLSERGARPSDRASTVDAPNVLILLLDTVRAKSLSLYGRSRPTSPELEKFAAGGVTFDLAFSTSPWTLPSHASLFTGRWPYELSASWMEALDDRWPTLAELLRARGYATAGFVANTNYASYESGLHRGFQHYVDYPISVRTAVQGTSFGRVIYPELRRRVAPLLRPLPLLWRIQLPRGRKLASAAEMNTALVAWLDQTTRRPFFAFVNYMDAHTPYAPPDSFAQKFRSTHRRHRPRQADGAVQMIPLSPAEVQGRLDAYEGAIAYLDSELGRLFNALQSRGLLANTLIVVISDHGDEFAEHGLIDHGNSLYRASLHVPLILHFPGKVPAGYRVAHPVSLRNVAATVLDLLGDPEPRALPGRSLSRSWRDDSVAPDTILASVDRALRQPEWLPASRGDMYSIAFDGWRLIRNEGDGREELYDFRNDSLELVNQATTGRGRAARTRLGDALSHFLVTATSERRTGMRRSMSAAKCENRACSDSNAQSRYRRVMSP